MKVLILALFFIAGALGRSSVKQSQVQDYGEGPRCPIDDPYHGPAFGPLPINVTLDPFINIEFGSQLTHILAEGLSTLWYKIEANVELRTVRFEVKLNRVTGNATYSANGYLDARPFRQETIPSGNFTGSGLGKVSATGVELKGRAFIYIIVPINAVQVSRVDLETVSFQSATFDLGTDFIIGGSPVDWANLSANFKANFDKDLAENKAAIAENIKVAANNVFKKYPITFQDMIDFINRPVQPCELD